MTRIKKSPFTVGELVRALFITSASLTGTATIENAQAQSAPEEATVRLKYVYYKDLQGSSEDRMSVKSPMVWFDAPMGNNWEVEGGLVLDSMSGASPLYLDTLSGASGTGVEDDRTAGDIKFTRHFDELSVSVGTALSDEDDYESRSGSLQVATWNEDKSRSYSFGISNDWDSISSTNDPELDESRRTQHYFAGITQILNSISMLQMNLSYSSGDGYFSDPYKLLDNRPRSREEWAWLTRYVVYLEDLDSSLHLDYRLYLNTWGLSGNMVEAQYYQPLGERVMIRPNIRYYLQDSSDLFNTDLTPADFTAYQSTDQRLAAFGGLSLGLKGIVTLAKGFELDALYQYTHQDSSNDIKPFKFHYVELGVMKKF